MVGENNCAGQPQKKKVLHARWETRFGEQPKADRKRVIGKEGRAGKVVPVVTLRSGYLTREESEGKGDGKRGKSSIGVRLDRRNEGIIF